jgi:ABC-type uncharacterized transport system permease subunit
MEAFVRWSNALLPIAYLALWLVYLRIFLGAYGGAARWSRRVLGGTLALHVLVVLARVAAWHRLPMATTSEFLSLLALSILAIYSIVEARLKVRATGYQVIALALLVQLLSSLLFETKTPDSPLLHDPGYVGHAVLVLLAYTALSIGFLYSLLYLIQARQLSRRHFGLFFRRLPSLEVLERMSVGAVQLGVPLLLGGLLTGHVWLTSLANRVEWEAPVPLSHLDPKILASWTVFFFYAAGLVLHRGFGWRGRRMNILSIIAFLALVCGIGLVDHFASSFHEFTTGEA